MNALEFARQNIFFERTSDISGAFDSSKYRFIEKPLLDLDNIEIKEMVIYKASGCMGTVLGQIALAYRISRQLGDMLFVCQTDDDADKWTDTRGRSFLLNCDPVEKMVRKPFDAVKSITKTRWLFSNKFMVVTGPGINAQNSDQVRFLQTDESHLYNLGVLAGFDGRMGDRWMRQALHVTTSADEGHDIDQRYHDGKQNEWFHRCTTCHELFWMVWKDAAKMFYNGEQVFRWKNSQSETETLESIVVICPHCQAEHKNTSQTRNALSEFADYVPQNPNATIQKQSYRWNRFAAPWLSWSDTLARWLKAIQAAKLGDLKPHEEFVKKVECRSYSPIIPDLGEDCAIGGYSLSDLWIVENKVRIGSVDVQDGGGLHFWCQADEFAGNGESRRIDYKKLYTWEDVRKFQLDHSISDNCFYPDATGRRQREIFMQCVKYRWFALIATDEDEFTHHRTQNKQKLSYPNTFYSMPQMQDSTIGKTSVKIRAANHLPPGFCLSRLWSKHNVGAILMKLKSSDSPRYYGIASDILPDYKDQLHSYVESIEIVKRTGTPKRFLKQVRLDDHSFSTSSMILVGAMIAGVFPLDFSAQNN